MSQLGNSKSTENSENLVSISNSENILNCGKNETNEKNEKSEKARNNEDNERNERDCKRGKKTSLENPGETRAEALRDGEVLRVWGLTKRFERERTFGRHIADWWAGRPAPCVQALSSVGLSVFTKETVGILGESGSGKSTLARILMGLIHPDAGGGRLLDYDLFEMRPGIRLTNLRRMQMVFQDPFGSLDPRMSVRQILSEPFKIHGLTGQVDLDKCLKDGLEEVGLEADVLSRYPAEFSGGQRQRIGICRALLLDPRILIADEAVSALDVSVQAQILELLARLKEARRLSLLFISHDVAVVRQLADRIIVLYRGRLVESLLADCLLKDAVHPYTKRLVGAALMLREGRSTPVSAQMQPRSPAQLPSNLPQQQQQQQQQQLPPQPQPEAFLGTPVFSHSAKGCPFVDGCAEAVSACSEAPVMRELHPGHHVACWAPGRS
ncbi:MAG: ABC transporter ATP-binding protein [Candidatus Ozemobacteraceae bacterium]